MKKELSAAEFAAKMSKIKEVEPDETDLAMMEEAKSENDGETITFEEYKAQKEYNGKLLIRVPKELHRQLVESAKANGVSLNQYALYKLAK